MCIRDRDNVADDLGRFLPGKRLEKERVPLLFEIRGCAGDDLKHVRVFKRNVPVSYTHLDVYKRQDGVIARRRTEIHTT